MTPDTIHADVSERLNEIELACGTDYAVGHDSRDAIVHQGAFESYACAEDEEKCEGCAKALKRKAA